MLIIRNLNLISVQSWTYLHLPDSNIRKKTNKNNQQTTTGLKANNNTFNKGTQLQCNVK